MTHEDNLLMKLVAACFFLAMFSCAAASSAQSCTRHSPGYTVALLELYTSEGCNSCPPAEQYISRLRTASLNTGLRTLEQFVPLSLHVDYWDDLGWKDILAKRAYTERQRWLAERASSRVIYTPEFFLAGKELRDWDHGVADAVQRINQRPAQADIDITIGNVTNGNLPVSVHVTSQSHGKLVIALYENALVSQVGAGENRGATLLHDFTVRDWALAEIPATDHGKNPTSFSHGFPVSTYRDMKNLGIAAFVQTDSGTVLQALALPLCEAISASPPLQ